MKKISSSILTGIISLSVLFIAPSVCRAQYDQLPENRKIGAKITNVRLPDMKGKMHDLTSYVGKGKVVLIDFWATWCRPCCMEMPNVKAAYDKYKKKGFNVVGISFDTKKSDWINYVKEKNYNWTHLSDVKGWKSAAQAAYSVMGIPSSILVDGKGKIIANDLRGEELTNKLKEIYGF